MKDERLYDLRNTEMVGNLKNRKLLQSGNIIKAFEKVKRHLFVPDESLDRAYVDEAIRLIKKSTISQPSMVAEMLELLQPKGGDNVLEIGTGSGWQAALLSECVGQKGHVTTIEIDRDVFDLGKRNIAKAGCGNVEVILGDGSAGYPRNAPYNKIIYTAATREIPNVVVEQLDFSGRIVAPIGSIYMQKLTAIEKGRDGELKKREYDEAIFVPLYGTYGFKQS